MHDLRLLLDLKCIENGIIQLSNCSRQSIAKQMRSLSPETRRTTLRKTKKLAKKAIKRFSQNPEQANRMMRNCGFLDSGNQRTPKQQRYIQNRRFDIVRRLFIVEVQELLYLNEA